jgi:DNA-directed RNA polymerase specialized sigma24 family protein
MPKPDETLHAGSCSNRGCPGGINALTLMCRIVFFLSGVEKCSVGENATFLKVTLSAVTSRLRRAHLGMRTFLNRYSRQGNHVDSE